MEIKKINQEKDERGTWEALSMGKYINGRFTSMGWIADWKMLKFLAVLKENLTEDKIIEFYQSHIQRYNGKAVMKKGKLINRKYMPSEIRMLALNWFDRRLGRAIRTNLLTEYAKDKLEKARGEGIRELKIKLIKSKT